MGNKPVHNARCTGTGCGKCVTKAEAKAAGWTQHMHFWTCPECMQKLNRGRRGAPRTKKGLWGDT